MQDRSYQDNLSTLQEKLDSHRTNIQAMEQMDYLLPENDDIKQLFSTICLSLSSSFDDLHYSCCLLLSDKKQS